MASMFTTIVVMMVCLIKYERHMSPFALLSFIAVIVDTMIAYVLSILNIVSILGGPIDQQVGIFATIFFIIATLSVFIVAEGKRAGKDTDTFDEKKSFVAKLF